jgi:hypothetical protein
LANSSGGTFKIIGFGFVVMVFMLITAFVFVAGAFLLLVRFIALILLMIFSPAMFLGWVFPGFAGYSKQWWGYFLRYALVAPAYLFMIYLSLTALNKMDFGDSSFGQASVSGSITTGLFGFFLYYLIVTGFVYASLVVAQKMGIVGATQAINISKGIERSVRGAALSYTVGGAAAGLLKDINRFEAWSGMRMPGSRAMRGTLEKIQSTKFAGAASHKEKQDYAEKRDLEIAKGRQINKLVSSIHGAAAALATPKGSRTTAQHASIIAMEKELSGTTKDQLIDMAKKSETQNSLIDISGSLKQDQVDAILNDKEVGDDFKNKLRAARGSKISSELGIKTGSTTLTDLEGIKEADKDQMKSLDFQTVMNGARFLQDSQVKELKGAFLPYQAELIKEKRKDDINAITNVAEAEQVIKTRKGEAEIAKLPGTFLESQVFADALVASGKVNVGLLKKIANESDANKPMIRSRIETAYGGATHLPPALSAYFGSDDGKVYA